MKMMIEKGRSATPLKDKKLFVFDLDGTVYLGKRIFPEAVKLVNRLSESGRKVLFFTNNASSTAEFYLGKLRRAGFEVSDDAVMTSGDVAASFLLTRRPGKRVFLLGTEALKNSMRQRGVGVTDCADGKSADIVVSSFDTELTFGKLTTACRLLWNGAEYFCTHPDLRCPTDEGYLPDSGAIAAMLTAATGVKPVFFGKPHPVTMEAITESTGFSKDEICVVGDRLYTDIAFAINSGVTSVLVLTGETDAKTVGKLPDTEMPDYVFENADGIYRRVFGKE